MRSPIERSEAYRLAREPSPRRIVGAIAERHTRGARASGDGRVAFGGPRCGRGFRRTGGRDTLRVSMLTRSALSLAASIRDGELSSYDVTRYFLDRAARIDPEVSAFVAIWRRRALLAAARRDLGRKLARDLPPLYGVPFAIKDLHLVRGGTTRFGSRGLPVFPSPIDDHVVARMRREGMVSLGKLTSSELGVMPVTEPDIHPPTRNPWDLTRSAGGSSGGSGAAVAAGMLPFAHGSDGAGSVRIPAAFCGLVGIKPSRGVVCSPFPEDESRVMHTSGPLAHGVEDAAALLDAMAKSSAGAYLRAAREARLGALRVGLWTESPVAETTSPHAAAAERVAKLLEARGCTVVRMRPPSGSVEEFLPLYGRMFLALPFVRWERTQPITRWVADHGRGVDEAKAHALQDDLARRLLAFSADVDLVVSPTTPEPPPLVGAFTRLPPREGFLGASRFGAFTALFNVTGQPAATVPVLDAGPLPIGVQIAGPVGADARVIAAARCVEQDLGGPFPVAPRYRRDVVGG